MTRNLSPEAALERLIEGNRLYASDTAGELTHAHTVHRRHFLAQQHPFAIILGCSDSRVPVEIIFSQPLGNLFVVRNAGYVLNDHVIGSIEYAVSMFSSQLVMVMGHSHCGAVTAAVEATLQNVPPASPAIASIINSISPAIERVREEPDVLEAAIAEHVRSVASQLRHSQPVLGPAVESGKLLVVGAEYHLSSALVTIIDGAPSATTTR